MQRIRPNPSQINRFEAYLVENFPLTSAMSYCIAKYVERTFIESVAPPANVVSIESISK